MASKMSFQVPTFLEDLRAIDEGTDEISLYIGLKPGLE